MKILKDPSEFQPFQNPNNNICYTFKSVSLLRQALTHKSFIQLRKNNNNTLHLPSSAMPKRSHNERLEFLGDAVLGLIIANECMQNYPHQNEGNLSKIRAALVNEKMLAEIARELNIGPFIHLGKGEDQSQGRQKNSILSDTLEAIIGAIFLDSDFLTIAAIVKRWYGNRLTSNPESYLKIDYKTNLQEITQSKYSEAPHYETVLVKGPDHSRQFTIQISLAGNFICNAEGKSKKQASQLAAQKAIDLISRESTFKFEKAQK